jgi:protein-S-isoprenylcysteine O-methyltransferase Ste14
VELREIAVVLSAVLYWGGVLVHVGNVKRRIGRPPNTRPKGVKETLLWIGWLIVIAGWLVQPFVIGYFNAVNILLIASSLLHPAGFVLGIALVVAGQAGTYWCYSALGDSWRIGVDRDEKTALAKDGPYRYVRHPIYGFQIIILVGVACLLPTILSLLILSIHIVCVLIKAKDEEAYLLAVHKSVYKAYCDQTGSLLPKLLK